MWARAGLGREALVLHVRGPSLIPSIYTQERGKQENRNLGGSAPRNQHFPPYTLARKRQAFTLLCCVTVYPAGLLLVVWWVGICLFVFVLQLILSWDFESEQLTKDIQGLEIAPFKALAGDPRHPIRYPQVSTQQCEAREGSEGFHPQGTPEYGARGGRKGGGSAPFCLLVLAHTPKVLGVILVALRDPMQCGRKGTGSKPDKQEDCSALGSVSRAHLTRVPLPLTHCLLPSAGRKSPRVGGAE